MGINAFVQLISNSEKVSGTYVKKLFKKSEELLSCVEKEKTIAYTTDEAKKFIPKSVFRALSDNPGLKSIERENLLRVQHQFTMDMITNIGKYSKGLSVKSVSQNFQLAKERLLKEMASVLSADKLKRIECAKTPKELTNILFTEEWSSYKILNNAEKSVPKGKTLLEIEQLDYAARVQRGKFIMAREKALAIPSTNKRVIEIETILREKYGVEFVSLKDDEQMAENILKAFETAKKENILLPKNVVISDFMVANGERIATENTILIASQDAIRIQPEISRNAQKLLTKEQREILMLAQYLPSKNIFSTNAPEHLPLHEIMHGTHPMLNAFGNKKIPSHMLPAKENLSLYSAISKTHETFTELATKKAIQGLSKEETELYNYLNFYS